MFLVNTENFDIWSAAKRQRRVLFALMLRNVRTRFFGNGFGYLVSIGWPVSHILIIVTMFSILGRAAPYGESTVLFVATGAVPFMTFSYLSRFAMLSVIRNWPLLAFPKVKVLDIVLASVLLEILAASLVVIILLVLAFLIQIDPVPRDIIQGSYAFGACIFLGLGFGLLNGVLVLAFPPWFTAYSLINIILWATSGVLFVPDALPDRLREILKYHPVLQIVEWTRSAYYEGYGNIVLDRSYPIEVGILVLFIGLLLERALRGHLLAYK